MTINLGCCTMNLLLVTHFMIKGIFSRWFHFSHLLYFSMDNHLGVLLFMIEQLKAQEFKETVIPYVFLLQHGPQTEQSLKYLCDKFLSDLQASSPNKTGKK